MVLKCCLRKQQSAKALEVLQKLSSIHWH
uniref:Uncharacterized protein n=1 Tax=Ignisphaera aggregans TaxID=334771 RepID=A0A7J3Z6S6_9CREN